MRAIILAAGQGTRLRPLTDELPKCLVPLRGKSLLERQVSTLRQAGIEVVHIVAGYRGSMISDLGFDTTINPDYETTNMVSSLFSALEFITADDSDLIVAYGDIVYECGNLEKLMGCRDDIGLMIDLNWLELWSARLDNPLDDAETLILDRNCYVTELGKKPKNVDDIQGQYTGLIKFSGRRLADLVDYYDRMDRTKKYDGKSFDQMYMTTFLQNLINDGWYAKGVLVEGGWLEVDSVEDLECYEQLDRAGELQKFYQIEKL